MADESPVGSADARADVDRLRAEAYEVWRALKGLELRDGGSGLSAEDALVKGLLVVRLMMDNWFEFCDDIDSIFRATEEYYARRRRQAES